MTTEVIVTLCTGIVAIIGAIGALLVSLRTAEVVKEDGKGKDAKLEQIHILVNSRLSEALTEIAQLRRYVADLTARPADVTLANKAEESAGQPKAEDASRSAPDIKRMLGPK